MVILITGASRGIGRAIANAFAGDGKKHTLLLVSKQREAIESSTAALQQSYPDCSLHAFACDLTRLDAVQQMAADIIRTFGAPDILVNNAGYFIPGSIHSEPEGTLEEMLQVNLMSAYQLTRAVLPSMLQKKQGHIFNICSIASLQAYSNGGSYSISKFALLGFGKNLREELKPHGIRVTNIMPGAVWTDSWSNSGVSPDRIMEAADVAAMVHSTAFLSSRACVEDMVLRPQLGDL